MPLFAGDKLGPYEILAPLGAGGMGEVYQARDTRLDRTVAVKVLPEHIANREDLRARFEREARAIASLNHPNICTLHDIGRHEDTSYMVMEMIEGESLAERIGKGSIPLDQALKLATQISDALDRAHRAGVTHRDIKPQNIMLTRDGVKVLDFGLAKSTRKPGPTEETLTKALTTEGTVLGTPQYMAPEQFEGKEADARSDIWAFGAVLYEMVTGRKAFQGKSYSSLVGAILSAGPQPMEVKPFTPVWLERLVGRCLAKDPEQRWQSMRDIVLELQAPPAPDARPSPVRFSPWQWIAAAALLLGAAVGIIYVWRAPRRESGRQFERMTRLTYDRISYVPALSPDGKLVAYSSNRSGNAEIWVQPVSAGSAVRLTNHPAYDTTPVFSADASKIYFRSSREPQGIYEIPVLGGEPRLFAGGGEDPSSSPDGEWLAYVRDRKIRLRATGGGEERTLDPTFTFMPGLYRYLAWSPDSRNLLVPGHIGDNNLQGDYFLIQIGDKATAKATGLGPNLTRRKMLLTGQNQIVAWLPDGEIIFCAPSGDAVNLWTLPLAELATGTPKPLTSGVFMNIPARLTGHRMVFANSQFDQTVWTLPADFNRGIVQGEPLPFLANGGRHQFPDLSQDGHLLSYVRYTSQHSLFVRNLITGADQQLSAPPDVAHPVMSPDGQRVAFLSDRKLMLIPASGGGPVLLNADVGGRLRGWSPDGRYLLVWARASGDTIQVIDVASGQASTILSSPRRRIGQPRISPNGRWLAAIDFTGPVTSVILAPFRGAQPIPEVEWRTVAESATQPIWPPSGRALYYLVPKRTLEATNVEMMRLDLDPDTGAPRSPAMFFYRFNSTVPFPAGDVVTNTPRASSDRLFFLVNRLSSDIWVMDWRK